MKRKTFLTFPFISGLLLVTLIFFNCNCLTECKEDDSEQDTLVSEIQQKLDEYIKVKLTADLSVLSEKEKQMLPLLFDIADIMNEIFWYEAFGDKNSLFEEIEDEAAGKLAEINYGPWNRLDGNKPFIEKYGDKPPGANFYPADITKEEFEAFESDDKTSQYTLIRRKEDGSLETIWYNVAFKEKNEKAAELLKKAAGLAEDEGLKKYLMLRADALLSDDYLNSDIAWMDMRTNTIDFIVGPIENYEDAFFGIKAAHEAFILIKDKTWSQRLTKYAAMLPELQKQLPVDAQYKAEVPGSRSDFGAYEVIYYAGDCNAGSKTIAINLPNDERVHLEKGSRKLQLKNAMKAKFDKILIPISNILIAEEQRKYVKFDAFFENVMFHEVAHGMGIKNTINNKGTVRAALKEKYSAIEEGKADILGLFLVTKLNEKGELTGDLMDNYVTFMASIFRSIRFGASSSHGIANLFRFNYFKEKGAFTKNENGTYSINFAQMQKAMNSLSELILTIQGDGDYEQAKKIIEEKGIIGKELQDDLDRLKQAKIPVDIVFEQGMEIRN